MYVGLDAAHRASGLFAPPSALSGVCLLTAKIRVMPKCWFVLMRLWIRVDGSMVRLRETRLFCRWVGQFSVLSLYRSKSVAMAVPTLQNGARPAHLLRIPLSLLTPARLLQARPSSHQRHRTARGAPFRGGASVWSARSMHHLEPSLLCGRSGAPPPLPSMRFPSSVAPLPGAPLRGCLC